MPDEKQPPSLKDALAADATLAEYKKAHPAPPKIYDSDTLTDVGNAKRLVEKYGAVFRYCYEWKAWLIWNGQIWKRQPEDDESGDIYRFAKEIPAYIRDEAEQIPNPTVANDFRKFAKTTESTAKIKAMITLAKSEPGIAISTDKLDQNIWLLNVKNGTLDLRTGELKAFDKLNYITKIANASYDPNAKAQIFLAFLDKIMAQNKNMVAFLQRAVGYTITGSTREEVLFLLHGTGGNGKSKFTQNAIANMMGDYAVKTPIRTVMDMKNEAVPNDIARLQGARYVYASEPKRGLELSEEKIKDMTGREKIMGRFLFAEWVEFLPEFKLFISVNRVPKVKGADKGIWRRLRKIPFIISIPEAEQDKDLDVKLHAEADGILAWAVQGCKEWLLNGLGIPQEVIDATNQFRDEMDSLSEFIENCCIPDQQAFTPHHHLYKTYIKFAEYTNSYRMSPKAFTQAMNERDYVADRKQGIRGFKYIKLTEYLTSVNEKIDSGELPDDYLDGLDRKILLYPTITKATHIPQNNLSYPSNVSSDNVNAQKPYLSNVSNVSNIYMSQVINVLKDSYDKYSIGNMLEVYEKVEKVKEAMERKLLVEIEDLPEDVDLRRFVDDYFIARKWE